MSSFEILNFLVIFGLIIAALCVFFLDDILTVSYTHLRAQ